MGYRVAVVGATGTVGREILKTLAEREFPVDQVFALGTGRAVGSEVSYGDDKVLKIGAVERFEFKGVELVFFAATPALSAVQAVRAAAAGAYVIDCTTQFRMEPNVPLLVPEVNPQALARAAKRRIIAMPGSGTVPLVVALKPLQDLARIKRVVVASYQPVSELGKDAMGELWGQTRGLFVNEMPPPEQLPKQIAFNVIPHVDVFEDDGATREEWRLGVETRKILDPDIQVAATCVRVPVFIGHALAVHVEFESPIGEPEAREALREAEGVIVLDKRDDAGYVTPVDSVGEDAVYVSRLRADASVEHGLAFWCVADNLRKGTALNAVQVAELLHDRGLLE